METRFALISGLVGQRLRGSRPRWLQPWARRLLITSWADKAMGDLQVTDSEPDPKLVDFSPVTALARRLFDVAKWLSPMQWLGRQYPLFRSRSELTQAEIQSKAFTKQRARAIEMYMCSWLGIETAIVTTSCLGPWGRWLRVALVLSVASRIIEVIQVTVNATVFDALSGRADELFASRARMIVLAGVNFVELWLCFGVIYAVDYTRLHGAGRPITAFYFSITTL